MSAEISAVTPEEVKLVGGGGGIFEIRQEGRLLWKKERSGHYPEEGEAARLFEG